MTELESHVLRQTSSAAKRDNHFNTLYRDTPLPGRNVRRTARPLPAGAHFDVPEREHLSDGILAGLAVLTLPAVVYSFAQLWSLLAGGSLTQAIRAFLP